MGQKCLKHPLALAYHALTLRHQSPVGGNGAEILKHPLAFVYHALMLHKQPLHLTCYETRL